MIVDSICVPGRITSTDGCVCAASKVLEEPGFTNHTSLTFKSAFTSSILSFIPVFMEFFCPKNPPIPAGHTYQKYRQAI